MLRVAARAHYMSDLGISLCFLDWRRVKICSGGDWRVRVTDLQVSGCLEISHLEKKAHTHKLGRRVEASQITININGSLIIFKYYNHYLYRGRC